MSNTLRQLQSDTLNKIINLAKDLSLNSNDNWREEYVSLLLNDTENKYLACDGEVTDIIEKLKVCEKNEAFTVAPLTVAGVEALFGSSSILNKYLWDYAIHCKSIIYSVIKSMSFTDNNVSDLEQDGYLEVISSLRCFKYATGTKFSTYVYPRLNVKLKRQCRTYNNSIYKSQRYIDEERLIVKLKETDNLDYNEILKATGWTKSKLDMVLRRNPQSVYVDMDESINIHATERDSIVKQLSDSQLHEKLNDELKAKKDVIPEREMFCLIHLIGFAVNSMSNSELAEHFGVSRAAVSNYKKRAIEKLRIADALK